MSTGPELEMANARGIHHPQEENAQFLMNNTQVKFTGVSLVSSHPISRIPDMAKGEYQAPMR
jgi:hypothetical protein